MIISLAELLPLRDLKGARLLGLDVGTKTIGLALSDPSWTVATPLKTIDRTKLSQDIEALQEMIDAFQVKGLVVGLPVNMDGTEGPRCQSTRQFVKNVAAHIHLPIALWDERLSTSAVERFMLEADLSRKKREKLVDKLAAGYILQGALDLLKTP